MSILVPCQRACALDDFDVQLVNRHFTFIAAVTGTQTLFTFSSVSEFMYDWMKLNPPPPGTTTDTPIPKPKTKLRQGLSIKSPLTTDTFVERGEIGTKLPNAMYMDARFLTPEICFPTSYSYRKSREPVRIGDVFQDGICPAVLVYDEVVHAFYFLVYMNGVAYIDPVSSEAHRLDEEMCNRQVIVCKRVDEVSKEGLQ